MHTIRGVHRLHLLAAIFLVLLLGAAPRLRALTDEEKKAAFLAAQADSGSSPTPHHKKHHHPEPSPTPHHKHHPAEAESSAEESPTPHHKHHPAEEESSAEESPTPHHKHHPTEEEPSAEESPTPHHKHHATAEEESPTPRPKHHVEPGETPAPIHKHHFAEAAEGNSGGFGRAGEPVVSPTPWPEPTATPPAAIPVHTPHPAPPSESAQQYNPPRAAAVVPPGAPVRTPLPRVYPAPTPPPGPVGAQIDIQKEGLEREAGLEPPPPTPPPHHHWWQFFSSEPEPQYRYLTRPIRDAIDRAPVARGRWHFIVVHNSGTRQGNAKIFDYYHLHVRKMPNGLAYHFVIGNGTSSGNGQIEIGNRWIRQIQGGHVHSDYLNNIALGICLVGDFNRDLPTRQQLEALDELIRYLRVRVGKTDGRPAVVKAHREINPPQWPTDCPGDRFPYHWLHSRFD